MPTTSKKQYKAMQAAAGGQGNLGIPPAVGQEMVAATPPNANLPPKAPTPKAKGKGPKKGKDFGFTK